jgi:hypothetical protein
MGVETAKVIELANALAEMGQLGLTTIRSDLYKLLITIVADACERETGGGKGTGEWTNVEGVKHATSVRVTMCGDPDCGRPHLVLYDSTGEPFAIAILPPATVLDIQEWGKRQ